MELVSHRRRILQETRPRRPPAAPRPAERTEVHAPCTMQQQQQQQDGLHRTGHAEGQATHATLSVIRFEGDFLVRRCRRLGEIFPAGGTSRRRLPTTRM